ncbi:MAG: Lrp/AsnC family transcriptional regulator [Clostridia bacterium]|jgi:DNA-binding Lrp family transcriptional regulator|nr:Lrp/AsnC family transcriptional regulator [Clostridia bacterium]NLF35612.1 Lrp/AsnC family transcriptional regulator [Clostridiaceae bacterium]MDD3093564.1 Lrp/AsnC family transcriptional regulator [Clostridia bacterium]MDD3970426.1 Lrp/AsnC family transcriptional regulator [Clostridia bacterium]MDD4542585.1 Lrp/AsnC family transcriptional regulator [Clostridia bacterium]
MDILELLKQDARLTAQELAVMTGKTVEEVERVIKQYEQDKVIAGYSAVINWEKAKDDIVIAFIEIRVAPERDRGFEEIAKRIYSYKQVKTCYLMSGSFDIAAIVEGKDLKEVALFVTQKLSTISGVTSTSTHFVLKKYKENELVFEEEEKDQREAIVL